jgi:hypothetical protein
MNQQIAKTFALLALVCAATVTAAGAQTVPLRANIPFQFHVGEKVMPAGQYQVAGLNNSTSVIKVTSAEKKTAALALKNTIRAKSDAAESRLVFRRYGNEYFLAQVFTEGTEVGSELPKSKAERAIINRLPNRYLAERAAPAFVTILAKAE